MRSEPKKAVALISGGLDSLLAAKIIMEQGIQVEGINFYTGFCVEGHTHAIKKQAQEKIKRNNALWVAEQLGIKLHIVDVIEDYKSVLTKPKHGYGSYLNPCLDCKIFMVAKAKQWLLEHNFDFIITGEVMGQRPMSQLKKSMPLVEKQSGAEDVLLRPLCAQRLPETLPERLGWVDRSKLYAITGRSRKPQFALAKAFGFTDYAQPAGGCCFLTNESYAKKLTDLWQARGSREYELDDVLLLKVGRHIRPNPRFKLIVAREDGEGRFLEGYKRMFTWLDATSHSGPLALLDGVPNSEDLLLAAQIVARYGQGRTAEQVSVKIVTCNGQTQQVQVKPLLADELLPQWLL